MHLKQVLKKRRLTMLVVLLLLFGTKLDAEQPHTPRMPSADVIIYGGTAGGILSAISLARDGGTVIVLEPSDHVGGMVTGGLGWTDFGAWQSIGGMAADFYRRIKIYYDDPAVWKFETRDDYLKRQKQSSIAEDKWWYHEPSAASSVLSDMMAEAGVTVLTGHRLASVDKRDHRIVSIRCDNGELFRGRVFIDATYEGDLMAMAGVRYRVGREGSAEYGEKYAGVVPRQYSTRKQWDVDISPYAEDGSLLFGIQDNPRGEDGAADRKLQAYNYRICLTDHPENRIPIEEPQNYVPSRYDLLARYIAAKPAISLQRGLLKFSALPNRKTDINDGGPFSTDLIGFNWDYPDGDAITRKNILQQHLDYTKGLLYFIGHDPRVPKAIRDSMLEWGYPKDEFANHGNWTPQLYVREARRMVGAYVMTSHDLETNRSKDDSIGMGSYGADSHLVQRIVDGGLLRNEGNPNDFTPGHRSYEIPYRAITPMRNECDNLLVTFCVSASHMGFASIRMEPVFMLLSESAGLAAMEAVREEVAVQDISYHRLRAKLDARNQILKLENVPEKH
jgi:hypothetical protein